MVTNAANLEALVSDAGRSTFNALTDSEKEYFLNRRLISTINGNEGERNLLMMAINSISRKLFFWEDFPGFPFDKKLLKEGIASSEVAQLLQQTGVVSHNDQLARQQVDSLMMRGSGPFHCLGNIPIATLYGYAVTRVTGSTGEHRYRAYRTGPE